MSTVSPWPEAGTASLEVTSLALLTWLSCSDARETVPYRSYSKFPAGALARPDYHPGEYLRSDDMRVEQHYLQQRLRRHDRRLHGWGVICGMRLIPANDPTHPWGVCVCP